MSNATAQAKDFADIEDDDAIRASFVAAQIKTKLPDGFSLRADGLCFDFGDDSGPVRVAGRIEVLAQTRDDLGASWGLLLAWKDDDGREHRWAMPRSMLAGDGTDLRAHLLDRGCYVTPVLKSRAKLLEYLATISTDARAHAVEHVGWANGAFALPDRTIGDTEKSRVIYQGSAAFDHPYRVSGSLADWQGAVALYGEGNSRLAVSISSAFVAPLLGLLGEEGGGINLRGPSSIGKSTALAAAASVWGAPAFVRQWRATANGLEGTAVLHNETLLCLDELAQLDAKEAGSVAYMLANGMGKARAGRTGALRSPARWRTFFLSSGEISLADLAGRDGRGARRSAAGQEIRILDVEADAGVGLGLFETLHGVPSAEQLARAVKDGAASCYGVAGPAFVEAVAADPEKFDEGLRKGIEGFARAHVPTGANGQVARAARRFGIVAGAGEIAIRLGILPWQRGSAHEAAATLFQGWLASRGGVGSSEDGEAVAMVRSFLEAHGSSRFEPIDHDIDGQPRVINRAGFWQSVNGLREHLILPEAWRKEVCAGLDAKQVARVLAERGILRTDAGGKHSMARTLPGLGKTRVYVVTPAIFETNDG